MPTRLRKSRRFRGSRTCGYGRVGQHRDQGSKPNRKVGRHKHKWSYVIRYEPDYFGKRGFTSPTSLAKWTRAINVEKLEEISKNLSPGDEEGKIPVDLDSMGFNRLLGSGRVSRPLIVKVASCSKTALQKISDAGGEVQTKAKREGE